MEKSDLDMDESAASLLATQETVGHFCDAVEAHSEYAEAQNAKDRNASINEVRQKIAEEQTSLERAALQLLDESQRVLQAALEECEHDTLQDIQARQKILERQRAQMKALQDEVARNVKSMSAAKASMIQQQFTLLTGLLQKKQEQLLQEEKELAEDVTKTLHELAVETDKRRQMLHSQHLTSVRQDCNYLLEETHSQQKELEDAYKSALDQHRKAMQQALHSARNAHESLMQSYNERREENRNFISDQMKQCSTLLESGKRHEALKIQKDVLTTLKLRRDDMNRQMVEYQEEASDPVYSLKHDAESTVEELKQQATDVFEHAKGVLKEQEEGYLQYQQAMLLEQTRKELTQFESAIRQHFQMSGVTLDEMLQAIRKRLSKQTADRQRRHQQQHESIITQARHRIIEMERRAMRHQSGFIKEQKELFTSSEQLLEHLAQDQANLREVIREEQLEQLNREAAETQAIIARLEKKHKEEWEVQRQEVLKEKLRIGNRYAKKHEESAKQNRSNQQATMMDMLNQCNKLVARFEGSQTRMNRLALKEKDKIRALSEWLEDQKDQNKKRHEHRQKAAQRKMQSEMDDVASQKEAIIAAQRRTDQMMSQSGHNMTGRREDYTIEQLQTIEAAKQQRDEQRNQLKALDKESHAIHQRYREACEQSRKEMKQDEQELQLRYNAELDIIRADMKDEAEEIKNEQRSMMQEHRELKMAMDDESNAQFREFKDEQRGLFNEAQEQLHKLEAYLLPDHVSNG